jgi:HPt (histidine-containing phosphotransfer) domain-containing protein
MDGIEATTRLLDEFPNVPPIIAVTANAFESDRERCFAAGMSGFLPKPLTLAMLREGLGNLDSVTDGDADAGDFDGEVDFEHFDSIMSAGQEAVEIFDDFCAEVPAQLENLNALSKNGGASEFAAGAHQLKGSFSAFGLASFSIKMGDFEEIGMSGDLSVLEDGWAQETIDHFRSTEASLRARL